LPGLVSKKPLSLSFYVTQLAFLFIFIYIASSLFTLHTCMNMGTAIEPLHSPDLCQDFIFWDWKACNIIFPAIDVEEDGTIGGQRLCDTLSGQRISILSSSRSPLPNCNRNVAQNFNLNFVDGLHTTKSFHNKPDASMITHIRA
jgi:hypothetical protein